MSTAAYQEEGHISTQPCRHLVKHGVVRIHIPGIGHGNKGRSGIRGPAAQARLLGNVLFNANVHRLVGALARGLGQGHHRRVGQVLVAGKLRGLHPFAAHAGDPHLGHVGSVLLALFPSQATLVFHHHRIQVLHPHVQHVVEHQRLQHRGHLMVSVGTLRSHAQVQVDLCRSHHLRGTRIHACLVPQGGLPGHGDHVHGSALGKRLVGLGFLLLLRSLFLCSGVFLHVFLGHEGLRF